jgi:hypothetical protein
MVYEKGNFGYATRAAEKPGDFRAQARQKLEAGQLGSAIVAVKLVHTAF